MSERMHNPARLKDSRSFVLLAVTHGLGVYNHNQLRGALLALVSFHGLTAFGMTPDTIVGLSTILVVVPFFLLSIPAGRICDRLSKATIIRFCKLVETIVMLLAAFGLMNGNVPVILLALFLSGIDAALIGPAKLGILPELLQNGALVPANSVMSAINSGAILIGLVAGTILALDPAGLQIMAYGGIGLAAAGFVAGLKIERTAPRDPDLAFGLRGFASDWSEMLGRLANPLVSIPVLGMTWFWFQGAINTTLFPLYVKDSGGLDEQAVSLLLVVAGLGVTAGALAARFLAMKRWSLAFLPALVFVLTIATGLDVALLGRLEASTLVRVAADFFIMAVAAGLFVVPLSAAIQVHSPARERARQIGLSNTISGLAIVLSGVFVIVTRQAGLSIPAIFGINAVLAGIVATGCLAASLPRLQHSVSQSEHRI